MEMIQDHCLRNACSYFYTGIKERYSTDLNEKQQHYARKRHMYKL